jgi:hypothetical protein
MMSARLGRQLLVDEVLRMHPGDEHLLVVGTVEMPISPRAGRRSW